MTDRVVLTGLRGRGRHGVLAEERAMGQEFLVDVALHLDTRAAAAEDALERTVDYGALAARVVAVVEGPAVALIETLAQRVADACLAEERVERVEVTVHKPHAPIPVPFAGVSVTVERRRPAPRRALLALGSNLGDRCTHLQGALDQVAAAPRVRVLAVSPVYETDPVGPDQPDYLNAAVLVETDLPAPALLALAGAVEARAGRERGERWGPRTLDVDVVAVGTETRRHPDLTLPHPHAHERAFVLAPWADVDPDAVLAGHGAVAALLADLGTAGIRRAACTLVLR